MLTPRLHPGLSPAAISVFSSPAMSPRLYRRACPEEWSPFCDACGLFRRNALSAVPLPPPFSRRFKRLLFVFKIGAVIISMLFSGFDGSFPCGAFPPSPFDSFPGTMTALLFIPCGHERLVTSAKLLFPLLPLRVLETPGGLIAASPF